MDRPIGTILNSTTLTRRMRPNDRDRPGWQTWTVGQVFRLEALVLFHAPRHAVRMRFSPNLPLSLASLTSKTSSQSLSLQHSASSQPTRVDFWHALNNFKCMSSSEPVCSVAWMLMPSTAPVTDTPTPTPPPPQGLRSCQREAIYCTLKSLRAMLCIHNA